MISTKNRQIRHRRNLFKKSIHSYTDDRRKILHILEYGILAPSTHNTQPWKIRVAGNKVDIFADYSKIIPEADPTGRDLHMSLGALIKTIELAAQAFGVQYALNRPTKISDKLPVATIDLKKMANKTHKTDKKALKNIISRQNYRGFFNPNLEELQKIEKLADDVKQPAAEAQVVSDRKTIKELAELTAKGLRMAYSTPEFRREISSYINHNLSRKKHGLHGYSLRMSFAKSVIIPKVMKRKDIGERLSVLNYKSFISAPAVVVVYSEDDKSSWITAGMVLQEMMVNLAGLDVNSSIYAAAIEMGDLRSRLAKLVPPKNKKFTPQLLFCVGKTEDIMPYSARKKLSRVLID